MIIRRWSLFFFILLSHISLLAQQFGGNPPSLRWRQINTDTARIIFPAGLDSQAQQVAAIVHRLSRTTLSTIGDRQHKINIVFQNQTTISNGYVGLAPFRSEFELNPEQNSLELGSLPWQEMLAIHEYRHVQQYNNFRTGLSKGLYYLFGEGGQEFANSLAIPNWFWEGDAVFQETLVSDQGRGRLPYFFNGYRGLAAAGKRYTWMKLRNGSLRDLVPDHYPLGYMLVAYGRQRYGADFWRKVTKDAAGFRGLFYPMQSAIRRNSGVSFSRFRQDALDWFHVAAAHAGAGEMTVQGGADADLYARGHRHFAGDALQAQFIGHDSLFYAGTSYRRIPGFYIRSAGGTHRIGNMAVSLDNYYSANGAAVVYAAYETDPRWNWRTYSVIRVLDLATGKERRLQGRTRYFAPDISVDGQRIVAVDQAVDGRCSLHLMDAATGVSRHVIPNTDSLFYTYPKFAAGGAIATAVRNGKGLMSLALIDTVTGRPRYILPFSGQTIAFVQVRGDTIWFTASREGKDRVYGWSGGQLFRVRLPHGEPAAGQYGFSGRDGQYAWTDYTAVGQLADTAGYAAIAGLEKLSPGDWVQPLATQGIGVLEEGAAHLLDSIHAGSYAETKYGGSFHLLNFHSWRPYVSDPDYTFSLVSENILNTLQSELYLTYNRNEKYKQVGVDATYGGLFPWLDAGVDYVFDRNGLSRRFGRVYWNEVNAYAGASIPLNYTHGASFTSLQLGSDLVHTQQYFTGAFKDSFVNNHFTYLRSYLSVANQQQTAAMQIYPRWAQTLYLHYDRSVTASIPANQFLASGYLYLPGLDWTHSLVLGAAWQGRDANNRGGFSDGFPWARGYSTANFYRMWRFAGNYHLPLLYPDWGLWNIVYFTRVRANGFFDYMKAQDFASNGALVQAPFRSYGAEVYFDTKWWNQLPISFGIRYSRLMDPDIEGRGPNQWELILPLNILSQGYSSRSLRPNSQ